MKYLYVIDKNTNKPVEINQVAIEGPHKIIFCKDRKTKQRYIMVRQELSDPFDISKQQLFITKFCQYDNVSVCIK